ncbi:UDP-glucose/GDP-mannose dehydrogenase family protein [bacterium]|nr:UDP-glucose/GDP-mannose dehydrogenase family protein [bacterium]
MPNVCMVGTGYVGLVSGACLADFGNRVICVDIDSERIESIKNGEMPIYEPGLKELVGRNVEAGRLSFTTDLQDAIRKSGVIFSAVGTPMGEDGSADLSAIFQAAKDIALYMDEYKVFVQKSTVPVGTSEEVGNIIRKNLANNISFDSVSNPEFLREGSAIEDFMRPDRVVIGVNSERAREVMREIYRPLYLLETPIVFTSVRTAELIKYASNSFLAVKISFINEIADLCEKLGTDVKDVARAMGFDKRIGPKFLHAGIGYGGSCLPKDVSAILHTAKELGVSLKIINGASDVNDSRVDRLIDKMHSEISELSGKRIALLGLSFKPNTDDLRHAPSLKFIDRLLEEGVRVRVYDPIAMDNTRKIYGSRIEYFNDPYLAMEGAEVLVIMTEWNEFRVLEFEKVKKLLKGNLILDCRSIYDKEKMEAWGFRHYSFGG